MHVWFSEAAIVKMPYIFTMQVLTYGKIIKELRIDMANAARFSHPHIFVIKAQQ